MDAERDRTTCTDLQPVVSRRRLLGGTAALGALSMAGCATTSSGSGGLPSRGEWLVRGGHVMTMDRKAGDLPGADVHVRDGAIVASLENYILQPTAFSAVK